LFYLKELFKFNKKRETDEKAKTKREIYTHTERERERERERKKEKKKRNTKKNSMIIEKKRSVTSSNTLTVSKVSNIICVIFSHCCLASDPDLPPAGSVNITQCSSGETRSSFWNV